METILKKKKRNNYTTLDNRLLQDSTLSFEARGLASSLLSRPDNWDINISAICKEGGIGREKANRIITELIKAGYMYRSQSRTSGKFGKNVLFISDEKDYLLTEVIEKEQLPPQSEKPYTVKPQTVNPQQQKKDFNKEKNITKSTTISPSKLTSKNKENKKSSSSYEFLNKFNLSPGTLRNINSLPGLTEEKFKNIFLEIKKQYDLGKIKSFEAVLFKALKGEWNLIPNSTKKENPLNIEKVAKAHANDCLSYLDIGWDKDQVYSKLSSDTFNKPEVYILAKEIVDDYFQRRNE